MGQLIVLMTGVGGVTVSMVAFQAVDPGSTPGRCSYFITSSSRFLFRYFFTIVIPSELTELLERVVQCLTVFVPALWVLRSNPSKDKSPFIITLSIYNVPIQY